MNPFASLDKKPTDPILGLNVLYKMDPRTDKINLGIGAYKDESEKVALFQSVHEAERLLLDEKRSKSYSPIDGDSTFQEIVLKLIYSDDYTSKTHLCAQTIGCTAALHVSGQLLKAMGIKKVHIPELTWQNHYLIHRSLGFETPSYPYYDPLKNELKWDEIKQYILKASEGEAIVLQVSCHNPVGRDPTEQQWRELAELIKTKKLFPVLDCAYQGFGKGLKEDLFPIHLFNEVLPHYFLCYSFSKNFGLYGERLGAFVAFDRFGQSIEILRSQVKHWIRACYSSPAIHGSRIVTMILQDEGLKNLWQEELLGMQKRLVDLRAAFVHHLNQAGIQKSYEYILDDRGLFSMMGLTREQVVALRENEGIYLVENGRINIAGLSIDQMGKVSESIKKVIESHA